MPEINQLNYQAMFFVSFPHFRKKKWRWFKIYEGFLFKLKRTLLLLPLLFKILTLGGVAFRHLVLAPSHTRHSATLLWQQQPLSMAQLLVCQISLIKPKNRPYFLDHVAPFSRLPRFLENPLLWQKTQNRSSPYQFLVYCNFKSK